MSSKTLKAAIIIVSTTASEDPTTDGTVPILSDVFANDGGQWDWDVTSTAIVPDNKDRIEKAVLDRTDIDNAPNLIVTSGGTGFAESDCTPEVVRGLLSKEAPGLVYGMMAASAAITPCKHKSSFYYKL
jgi:gephyrin